MPFDSSSGPPASAKQMEYLEALLRKAGYEDYREARGPLGLTQRQGRGKFTKREASELISQLLDTDDDEDGTASPEPAPSPTPAPPRRTPSTPARPLSEVPDVELVAELRRRGWTVVLPE